MERRPPNAATILRPGLQMSMARRDYIAATMIKDWNQTIINLHARLAGPFDIYCMYLQA